MEIDLVHCVALCLKNCPGKIAEPTGDLVGLVAALKRFIKL
jgi:hypothetical protein